MPQKHSRTDAGDRELREGDTGFIYDGPLETEVTVVQRGEMPRSRPRSR